MNITKYRVQPIYSYKFKGTSVLHKGVPVAVQREIEVTDKKQGNPSGKFSNTLRQVEVSNGEIKLTVRNSNTSYVLVGKIIGSCKVPRSYKANLLG